MRNINKKLTQPGNLSRRPSATQRELPLKRGEEIANSKVVFQLKSELNRLQQRDREWKLMFSMLGHDLKEPLVTLEGFTKILEEEKVSPDDQKRYLKIIREAIHSLHLLVNSMQSVSKLYQNSTELIDISLIDILKSALTSLSRQISKSKAVVELPPEDLQLKGDPVRLFQIFLNLIGNSLKFVRQDTPPLIKVETRTTNRFYRVSISDNGMGMSPEDMKKIFEPFTKLDGNFEGMGMGLSIVRRIAESFGGRVLVKSSLGTGTTFTVLLPRSMNDKRKRPS